MRKIIAILAAALCLAACQKPYTTKIDLGVNQEEIVLPTALDGHCFITVYSNSSWTISVTEGADWARLGVSSGQGIGYVRLDFTENLGSEERKAKVKVSGSGKTCEILVTQPAA